MSLTRKIDEEIKRWEDKIAAEEARITRMKLEIKSLRHLQVMAKMVEGNER